MLRAKYFSTALSFTAIFDSGCLIWCGLVGWWLGWDVGVLMYGNV